MYALLHSFIFYEQEEVNGVFTRKCDSFGNMTRLLRVGCINKKQKNPGLLVRRRKYPGVGVVNFTGNRCGTFLYLFLHAVLQYESLFLQK